MTRSLTLLFAVAGAAAVGNLYWAQPILEQIARSFDVDPGTAGLLVTVTQVGYAVGIFFLVPLGDIRNRRHLIPLMMVFAAIALGVAAVVPSYALLLVSLALVGCTSVAGQMLSPLAGDLADPATRGRVVSTISSGMLIGILSSRIVGGLIADALGWRAIYGIAAVLTLLLGVLLWRRIPTMPQRTTLRYPALLKSVFVSVRAHRAAPPTLLIAASAFGTFSMFWTSLTFLLSAPPFSFSPTGIGLMGIAGLAGAVAARRAGSLHDRGLSTIANGIALVVMMAALVLAAVGAHSLIVLILAIVLFDIGAQAVTVLSQTRLYSLDPASRSRLNTGFVTANFIGGALGSGVAAVLWSLGGWTAICLAGVLLVGFGLAVWSWARLHAFRIMVAPTESDKSTAH